MGLGLVLLLFSFFYQLGIYPLFLEEPRRALIALEMVIQDNYWAPTVMGDFYHKKPPVYNWLVVVGYKFFGYQEIASRVISILSHFALTLLIFLFTKNRIGTKTAVYAAMGYLLSVDILFYYSLLGEIDLFYALVTTTMIFMIYHFGEKRSYWKLFLLVYTLTAVGFLTKGLSSLPFTAISLLVYFIQTKNFKKLLSISHISGILLFILLVSAYFLKYAQYGDVNNWWKVLYSESADKAVQGGVVAFIKHFFSFPISMLLISFPAVLLLPVWLKNRRFAQLRQHRFVWYCILIFGCNVLIYWFSIQGKSRYVYPILPFLIIALTSVLNQVSERTKYFRIICFILMGTVSMAAIALPFVPGLESLQHRNLLALILLCLTAGVGYFYFKHNVNPYLIIMGVLVIMKLAVSSIVPITRTYDSGTAKDKASALEIAALTKDKPVYRYGHVDFDMKTAFYVEREKMQILKNLDHFDEQYYIVSKKDFPVGRDFNVLYQLRYSYDEVYLIEMLK